MVLAKPPRVLFLEIKTAKGKLSKPRWNKAHTRLLPGQDTWAAMLQECPGIEYRLVRPADLDAIYALLQKPISDHRKMAC